MEMDNYDVELDELGESSGGLGKVVLIGLGVLGAGAVALAVKNKEKIKDWNNKRKIAKLEKQGFVVVTPEELEEAELVEAEVIDAEETVE
jgi:hypothetical protein